MSKTARAYCIRPLTVAIMLIACNIAFGQKPTVSVMVNDNTSNKSKKLSEDMKGSLRSSLEEAMLEKYALFDRTDDVLKMIMESHALDRSGLVDTNTIKKIGEQIGVDFLCVITTTWPIDAYKLEARLTNVRTRRVYPANANSLLNANPEIDSVAARLARKLYKYADSKSVGGAQRGMKEMSDYDEVEKAADEIFNEIVPPAKADEPKVVYVEKPAEAKPKAGYANYTSGERVGTFVLNFVPGLGSAVVMGDWTGALILLALGGGGAALVAKGVTDTEKNYHYQNPNRYTPVLDIGIWTLVAYLVFNIGFSTITDKPKDVVNSEYGNFNMAVLPNRHGGFAPYLMYNKAF